MTDAAALIRSRIASSIAVKQALLDGPCVEGVERAAAAMTACLRAGGRVFFCGNGGSAADAMHLAAELVGRFQIERDALPAMSLSDNVATLTAVANDYDFTQTFARQLRGLARDGDVLVALSTSGDSPNVIAAVEAAAEIGVRTIGCTGERGGRLAGAADIVLRIPSDDTARIQEGYMLLCHTAGELVERELFAGR